MMKLFFCKVFALVVLLVISSCDDTFEQFIPPKLDLVDEEGNPRAVDQVDSIKNVLKQQGQHEPYQFTIYGDEDKLEKDISGIRFELKGGTGVLKRKDGVKLIDQVGPLKRGDSIVLQFFPGEASAHYHLFFYPRNRYGVEGLPTIIQVIVFANMLPEAHFSLQKDTTHGDNIIVCDASKSYDRDAKYGGTIETYQYSISSATGTLGSGSIFRYSSSPTLVIDLPRKGKYTIQLVVYDNDGGRSQPYEVDYELL